MASAIRCQLNEKRSLIMWPKWNNWQNVRPRRDAVTPLCTFGRIIRLPSRKAKSMKTKLTILGLCLAVAFPLLAQKKEDERLENSARGMKEILGAKGLPTTALAPATCVLSCPTSQRET